VENMKNLLLERRPTTATECEGFLSFDREILATIERPWVPADTPGGKPFESCVPDGMYDIHYHERPDGSVVPALINPLLGVHYLEEDLPDQGGRYLILMHVGNWVTDVVGCVAPGLSFGTSPQGPMVKSSKAAMKRLMNYLDNDTATLEIRYIK
jgi:hypothetical protein